MKSYNPPCEVGIFPHSTDEETLAQRTERLLRKIEDEPGIKPRGEKILSLTSVDPEFHSYASATKPPFSS